MRRNLSLNRLCFGDFKHFSSCKNPWVRCEDDFFSFGSLNQIHRANVSSSENPVQTSDLASRVKLWRVIVLYVQILKKRDTYSSPRTYRASLTGQDPPGNSETIHYEFKWFETKVWLPIRWWIRKLRLSSQVLKSVKHYIRPF